MTRACDRVILHNIFNYFNVVVNVIIMIHFYPILCLKTFQHCERYLN
jgi:hypothetical protein